MMLNWEKFRKKKNEQNKKQSIDNSWFLTGKKEIVLNDIDFEIMGDD